MKHFIIVLLAAGLLTAWVGGKPAHADVFYAGVYGSPGAYGYPGAFGYPGAYGFPGVYGYPGAYGYPGVYGDPGAYGYPGVFGYTDTYYYYMPMTHGNVLINPYGLRY